MRRLFVALTSAMSVVAFTHMASAADVYELVYKAAPPAPTMGWSGWYAGVNFGASFGNVKTDFNAAPVTVTTLNPKGSFTTPGFAGSDTVYPDGFMGGGQIGYNWQFSPIWVVGLEADFQGALEKDSSTITNPFSFPFGSNTVTGSAVTNYDAKIEWFGTARLRAGYVWGNGNVISYVTGGLAYGKVEVEGTNTVSGTVGAAPFSITHAIGHSNVNVGWTVGYGTEGRLGNSNWSWKIEGLYMDLGHLNDTDQEEVRVITVSGGQVTTNSHFTDGILRGGLNYHF